MAGYTIWNLLGSGLPLVFGLVAFPIMINENFGFGKERLEIIGIVWMLVGFSSIMDMGLGRALTKLFAEKLSLGKNDELAGVFWTAVVVTSFLGLLIGILVILFLPDLATQNLNPLLRRQVVKSFIAIGCAIPIMVLNVGLLGVLQACQKFKMINIIRILFGSYTFLSPLAILLFTKSIFSVVIVLLCGRLIEMLAYFIGCIHTVPELRTEVKFRSFELKPLLSFGGWMTISNVSVGIMTHINRFVIRTLEKIGEGTYYFIPEELVIRLLIIPRAWIEVLFPALVTSFSNTKNDNTELFSKGAKYLLLVMLPVVLGLSVFAYTVFSIWLPDGEIFAEKSAFIVICLTLGIFVHSIARFIWYFIQAAGRPDLAARLHLAELPIYMFAVYFLIRRYGINGAAMGWTLRIVVDFVFLTFLSTPFLTNAKKLFFQIGALLLSAIALILAATYPTGLLARIAISAAGLPIFYAFAWFFMLSTPEHKDLSNIYYYIAAKLKRG
jgi:O-antigen/teichoic acid export membrane protein